MSRMVTARACARLGLMGNPGDAVGGSAVTLAISDLWAEVTAEPSERLQLIEPESEHLDWEDVSGLMHFIETLGYHGARPLMLALIRRLLRHPHAEGLSWPPPNFALHWISSIPPRVGLGGSSALLTAALRAIAGFWDIKLSARDQVKIVMTCETKDLGIPAGPQDRVAQVHQGLSYLEQNYGGVIQIEALDPDALPPLFVAIDPKGSEGTEVYHASLRERCEADDTETVLGVRRLSELASLARDHLRAGRGAEIGPLMDENFEIRRRLTRLNPRHERMVDLARQAGAHAKFAGSGGAIVGTCAAERMTEVLEFLRGHGMTAMQPTVAPRRSE